QSSFVDPTHDGTTGAHETYLGTHFGVTLMSIPPHTDWYSTLVSCVARTSDEATAASSSACCWRESNACCRACDDSSAAAAAWATKWRSTDTPGASPNSEASENGVQVDRRPNPSYFG